MNTTTDIEGPWLSEDDEIWFSLVSELFREVDTCCLRDEDVLRYYRMFKAFEQRRIERERKAARRESLLAKRKGWRVIDGDGKGAQSAPESFEHDTLGDAMPEADNGAEGGTVAA